LPGCTSTSTRSSPTGGHDERCARTGLCRRRRKGRRLRSWRESRSPQRSRSLAVAFRCRPGSEEGAALRRGAWPPTPEVLDDPGETSGIARPLRDVRAAGAETSSNRPTCISTSSSVHAASSRRAPRAGTGMNRWASMPSGPLRHSHAAKAEPLISHLAGSDEPASPGQRRPARAASREPRGHFAGRAAPASPMPPARSSSARPCHFYESRAPACALDGGAAHAC